jgi:hypothetical protein
METRKLSMHHGSSKDLFYSNRKRLLQILATSFTQEQEQMGEREKSGRGVGEIWA